MHARTHAAHARTHYSEVLMIISWLKPGSYCVGGQFVAMKTEGHESDLTSSLCTHPVNVSMFLAITRNKTTFKDFTNRQLPSSLSISK